MTAYNEYLSDGITPREFWNQETQPMRENENFRFDSGGVQTERDFPSANEYGRERLAELRKI